MQYSRCITVLCMLLAVCIGLSAKPQQSPAMEGRVVYFDGQPAANVRLEFNAKTDIKEEIKNANKVVTTDKNGEFRVSNLIYNRDYKLEEVIPYNAAIGSEFCVKNPVKVWINNYGTKMLPEIMLLPKPKDPGFYYQNDLKSKLVRLNDSFTDDCRVEVKVYSEYSGYYYVDSLAVATTPIAIEITSGGLLIEQGFNVAGWAPRPPEIQYQIDLLSWVYDTEFTNNNGVIKVPGGFYRGISGFGLSNDSGAVSLTCKNGLERVSFEDYELNQYYLFHRVFSFPGKYLFHKFTPGGYNRYFEDYGYMIGVK